MRVSSEEAVGLMQRPNGDGFPPVRSLFTALPPAGERGTFGHARRQVSHFPLAMDSTSDRDLDSNFGPSRRSRRNSLFRQCPYPEASTSPTVSSPSGGVMLRSLNLARHALSAVPMMTSLFKKVVSSSQEPVIESRRFSSSSAEAVQFSSASHRERDSSPVRDDFRLARDPGVHYDESPSLGVSLSRRPALHTESPIQQKVCSPPPSRQPSPPPVRERLQSSFRETSAKGQSKPMTTSRRNVATVLKSIEKEYKDHLTLADFRTFQNRRRGILGNELKRLIKAQELAVTSRCIDYEQSERATAADEADTRAFTQVDPKIVEGLPQVLDLGSESEPEEDRASNEPQINEERHTPQIEPPPPRKATVQPTPAVEEKKMRRIEAPPAAPPDAEPIRPSIPESAVSLAAEPVVPASKSAEPVARLMAPVSTPIASVSTPALPVANITKPAVTERETLSEATKVSETEVVASKPRETPTKDLLTPTPLFGNTEPPQVKEASANASAASAPQAATSLFSSTAPKTSLFQSSTIFGGATEKPAIRASEPSGSGGEASKPTEPAETEKPKEAPKSLFGLTSNPPPTSIFGSVTASEPIPANGMASSLFETGTPKPSTNPMSAAFPMPNTALNPSEAKTSPFGTAAFPSASNQPSLFGNLASGTMNASSSSFGDQSKPPTSSIFGIKPSVLEATSPAVLFGTPAATNKPTDTVTSLFGNQQANASPPASSSLFGRSATTNTPLFGAASTDRPSPTGSLFGSAVSHVPTTVVAGQSLFGAQPSAPSLFGQQQQQQAAPNIQSLFGGALPASPFGSVTQNTLSPSMPQAAPLFGNTSPTPAGAIGATSSIFAAGTPQPSFNQSPFANSQPQGESQENPFTQAGGGVRYRIRRKRNP